MQMTARLSTKEVVLWILCLAMIAVGAKNFEIGFSIDAPFYSAVSRNMARSGNWIEMSASTPDFVPYAEHPHLGYWTQSVFFKLFGATDPVARIPSQLFYVLCMLVLFFGIRKLSNQSTAVWTILLLWSWDRFSNYFSNAYLDPGLLFFSGSSLFIVACKKSKNWIFAAGVLLGLGFMQKAMVNAGFGPAFAFLFLSQAKVDFKQSIKSVLVFIAGLLAVLAVYFILIKTSTVPNFFEIYWASQSKQRFGNRWDWHRLWGAKYWWQLLKDTHFMAPLALLCLPNLKKPSVQLPLILIATFSTMYACANLNGGQYWITILPWLAWLIAENLLVNIPVDCTKLLPVSKNLAIALLFLVQYTPFRVHGVKPPVEVEAITAIKNKTNAKFLIVDNYPLKSNFGDAGVYVWYNDLTAKYPSVEEIPRAELDSIYLLLNSDENRKNTLTRNGWCAIKKFEKTSVWLPCQSPILFRNASLFGSRPKNPLISS